MSGPVILMLQSGWMWEVEKTAIAVVAANVTRSLLRRSPGNRPPNVFYGGGKGPTKGEATMSPPATLLHIARRLRSWGRSRYPKAFGCRVCHLLRESSSTLYVFASCVREGVPTSVGGPCHTARPHRRAIQPPNPPVVCRIRL